MANAVPSTCLPTHVACALPNCEDRAPYSIGGHTTRILDHVLYWHTVGGDQAYKCGQCGFNSTTTEGTIKHVKRVHGGGVSVVDERHVHADDVQTLIAQYHPELLKHCKAAIDRSWRLPQVVAVSMNEQEEGGGVTLTLPQDADSSLSALKDSSLELALTPIPVEDFSLPADFATSMAIVKKRPVRQQQQATPFQRRASTLQSRLKCVWCSLMVSKHLLWRHAFVEHSPTAMFSCPHCLFKSNTSESVITAHLRRCHPRQEQHVINNCKLHPEIVKRCFPSFQSNSQQQQGDDDDEEDNLPLATLLPKSMTNNHHAQAPMSSLKHTLKRPSTSQLEMDVSIGESAYQCRICLSMHPSALMARIDHYFKYHAKEMRFKCSYCDNGNYDEKELVEQHVTQKHPGQPVECIDLATRADNRAQVTSLFMASGSLPLKKRAFPPPVLNMEINQRAQGGTSLSTAAAFSDLMWQTQMVNGVPVLVDRAQNSNSVDWNMGFVPMMVPFDQWQQMMQAGGQMMGIRAIENGQ